MAEQGTSEAPLPTGYRVQEFLPDNWCWDMQGENGEWVGDGSHFATEEGAVVGAWQDYADTLEQVIAAPIDPKLAEFYQVSTVAELLAAQEEHILKLQDSARRNVKPWEDTFPPTLLPKYLRDSGLDRAPRGNFSTEEEGDAYAVGWVEGHDAARREAKVP